MKLTILHYPDPLLAETCKPVEVFDEELQLLAENMLETMYSDSGIGLAAPQVGDTRRLIVLDVTGPDVREAPYVVVNPVIVERRGECSGEEGCLSVPNMRTQVTRSEYVVVEGQDLKGQPIRIEADDILAVCLQHEIDHLNGTLIIDHISRLKRMMYDKKVRKWMHRAAQHEAE